MQIEHCALQIDSVSEHDISYEALDCSFFCFTSYCSLTLLLYCLLLMKL